MASATVAKLNVHLGLNAQALIGGLASSQAALRTFGANFAKVGAGGAGIGGLAGMASMLNPVALGIGALGAAVGGATWAVKLAADMEQLNTSFTVLLGSAEKAKAMMDEIQSFAASTPFESTEIAAAAKSLLAFGVAQDQIIPSMRMLGDLSSGLNIPIGELSELYGKAKTQGRLFMEDINQLTGRGIPIIAQLAKNFGVAETEIRKMVERGEVGFPQLQAALFELTKEGSQFGGMMEKQSQTFWGQLSTLWDNIKLAVGGVGKQFIGVLTEMLKLINAALDRWNKFWGNTPKEVGKIKPIDMDAVREGMKPAVVAAKEIKQAGDQYADAMARARELVNDQARSAREIRENLARGNQPVAAMQFGTQAAISAVAAAQREQKLQLDVDKQILAENKAATLRLKNIEAVLRGQRPVDIKEVVL